MLIDVEYNRIAAVNYALQWAYSRNPRFYDFENIGGDCTNFVSQCLYAGCGVMNYSGFENGWFYINGNNRSASWTGVVYLRRFLLTNTGTGVYGESALLSELNIGDVVQLGDSEGNLYHSLFISYVRQPAEPQNIYVCAHSNDARDRRLSTYNYAFAEGVKILGARREEEYMSE